MASVRREEEAATATATATASTSASSASLAGQGTSERREAEEPTSRPSTAEGQEQLDAPTMLRMRAYRNLRYHSDRQSHYERLTRVTNFVLVLLGSASFAVAVANSPFWTATGAAAVTIVASAQLVFDFSRRAKEEDVLKLECSKILVDAEEPGAEVSRIEAAMAALYGRELETYHAVNAMAYNATQLAFGRPKNTLLAVKPWQKWLRNWWVFTPEDFPDVDASEPLAG